MQVDGNVLGQLFKVIGNLGQTRNVNVVLAVNGLVYSIILVQVSNRSVFCAGSGCSGCQLGNLCTLLVVEVLVYGVLARVLAVRAVDFNIMRGHLEVLSILVANFPAGEGVAVLGRNGSDYNVGIEVVDIRVAVNLAVNLVDYLVMVDSESTVKENVLCRHGELAISNLDNVCNVSCRSPTVEGVAGLGRLIKQSNFLAIYVRRNLFFIVDFVNTAVNKVAYGENVLDPLCVQIQAGHQNLRLIGSIASCVGIPAAELITVPSQETGVGIVERRIVGAGPGGVFIDCIFTEIRMVGNVDCNVLDVAVNMIAIGVEYAVLCVVLVVSVVCCLFALFGQMTCVTGLESCTLYTAVADTARQVLLLALVSTARRSAECRQEDEVHSLGQFRFGFRFGFRIRSFLGGELCVQSQIVIRHRVVFPLVHEICIGVPTLENAVILLNCRSVNLRIGPNPTWEGVLAVGVDGAAVRIVSQLHRLNVRPNVNLNGSVAVIGLGKVEAELILAVVVYGRGAESGRVEFYVLDGVAVGVSLANQNGRNGKGLVVPELPIAGARVGTVSALDVNLIGHAAAVVKGRLVVNSPVGNVDLNHPGVIGANQIVEYQLVVAVVKVFPIVGSLNMVLEILPVRVMITDSIDFSTGGAAVSAVRYLALPSAEYTGMAENGGFVADDVVTDFGCQFSNGNAVLIRDTGHVRTDSQRVDLVFIGCASVGNPILSCKRLGRRDVHREVETVDKAVGLICRVLRLVVYVGSAVCCTVVLRIVFRSVGRSVVIARLRAVRTAVCFVARRSRCGILILGLCLGLRRSGISGSFGGVCCGSGINHRYCDFFVRRKKCDVLIVGQRPTRAHGQHHDSRKSSCEQTFARILF